MKKRIIQKTFNDKTILYEVEKKWPILGWRLIYIDCGLYDVPAIFNTLSEAVEFMNPDPGPKVVKKLVVLEQ